jgi:hypothetical protein
MGSWKRGIHSSTARLEVTMVERRTPDVACAGTEREKPGRADPSVETVSSVS